MSTELLVTFVLAVGLPVALLVEDLLFRLGPTGPAAQAADQPATPPETVAARRAA
jgi:hypothetical protein